MKTLRAKRPIAVAFVLVMLCGGIAKADSLLKVPGRGLDVNLATGLVGAKGQTGLCLETVSRSGSNLLVASRKPGDDMVRVEVNGTSHDLTGADDQIARVSGLRLARDGSLFHLRVYKTGERRTDLVQDGRVRKTWGRGVGIRLVAVAPDYVRVFEDDGDAPVRLVDYARDSTGALNAKGTILATFPGCVPGGVRAIEGGLLIERICSSDGGDLIRLDLQSRTLQPVLKASGGVRFLPVAKTAALKRKVAAVTVSGTPSAMHFFHAATGLLLSQTGEVRACASDAEGLQSWNQSYRLRALTRLWEKTRSPVFSALARKSMRLTLAARDGENERTGPQTPRCGWSSLIYGKTRDERLSLMINQAMIANALGAACRRLDGDCPSDLEREIAQTRRCLLDAHEPFWDVKRGLYRIRQDAAFRFAGKIAPWNWQISMAALLAAQGTGDAVSLRRARELVTRFVDEWETTADGALWRYWPQAYYYESGLAPSEMARQRYEDTGHAGISLLALNDIVEAVSDERAAGVRRRLDTVLSHGTAPPRDLNGTGPRSARWYPASGWAAFATSVMAKAYSARVPGSSSADTLEAYATLYDPAAPFELQVEIHGCASECEPVKRSIYKNVQSFVRNNPFFTVVGQSSH